MQQPRAPFPGMLLRSDTRPGLAGSWPPVCHSPHHSREPDTWLVSSACSTEKDNEAREEHGFQEHGPTLILAGPRVPISRFAKFQLKRLFGKEIGFNQYLVSLLFILTTVNI